MADSPEEPDRNMVAHGNVTSAAGSDARVGLCDRMFAGGGNSDGNLRGRGNDAAVECAGDPGCELCGNALAVHVDPAVCPARWVDVRIGTATVVGENADAWFADADAVGLRKCCEPGTGRMAGACRADGGFADPGVDAGIAAGSGTGAYARAVVGSRRDCIAGRSTKFGIWWGAQAGDI